MAEHIGFGAVGTAGLPVLTGGQSDLALAATAAGLRVITTTGTQGGLLARDAETLAPAGQLVFGAVAGRPAAGQVETVSLGGRPALLAFGAGAGARICWLDRADPLAAETRLAFGGETLAALAAVPLGAGRDAIYAATLRGGLAAWQRAADGTLSRLQDILPAGDGPGIADLAVLAQGGSSYLLAATPGADLLSVYRLDGDGRAALAETLGPADGIGLDAPARIATATQAGRSLVFLGAAGSGSLTVAELGAGGRLAVLDQVNDDLATRFRGVTVLEAAVVNGRILVVAGGSDGGLTAMELLPGGRLALLGTLADTHELTLADPAGLALAVSGQGIDIFVASGTEAGVTRLRLGAGGLAPALTAPAAGGSLAGDARADLLAGGAGDDRLDGGAGNDILVDGAGRDRLTGGAGADLFVFRPDGQQDVVTDFEPGIDRLDLSALGRIHGTAALQLIARDNGIEIRFGAETIRILAADGRPIAPAALADADVAGLWHVAPTAPDSADRRLEGGAGPDMLLGRAGADLLAGDPSDAAFDAAASAVYRLYLATLDRQPQMAGHLGWTTMLLAGAPQEQVARGFVDSPEFRQTYGALDDTGFVTLLFRNVLGREPGPGLAAWVDELASGRMSRAEVVLGFSNSAEFKALTQAGAAGFSFLAHQGDRIDDVYRLFGATLAREPAEAGLLGWSEALARGAELAAVATGFVDSPEFRQTYGALDDTGFVTLLFRNVLGREPGPGLAAWVDELASGRMSRAEVVLGFSQSAEYIRACAAAVTAFMRGLGPDDRLDGGPGDDLLIGGLGADVFVFDRMDGPGTDRVADPEPWDLIELGGFGYASAAEALSHFTQAGPDVLFRDQGMSVIFQDLPLAALRADMLLV